MTEVWEEKLKTGSENIEADDKLKQGTEKNDKKDASFEKTHEEEIVCDLCGRIFKNHRALKIHKRACKRKKEMQKKEGEGEAEKGIKEDHADEIFHLRKKMMNEMEAIKEERRSLEEERSTYRTQLRRELEKLREEKLRMEMKHDTNSSPTSKDLHEGKKAGLTNLKRGVMVLEENEDFVGEEGLDEMEEDLDRIAPDIAAMGKGISTLELEEITAELEAIESDLNTKVDFAALTRMSEDYESSMGQMEESITALNLKIDSVINRMEESATKYGTYQNVVKEIGKLDDKTTEILEEIGFGESLNVAKIPPNILESVYESTIEGVVNDIHRNYGSHDAENIISRTLEDIRTRTSGSELFYFDGRYLKTRNLARSIQNKLISAKQVQTTYDELLRKLLEYLPGYKAKNFRAMIKLKSQEYAVDKTTLLLESIETLKEHIDNLKNMVGSVSNRQNTIEVEINRIRDAKAAKDDLNQIRTSLEEIKTKQSDLDEALKGMIEEQKTEKKTFSDALVNIHTKLKDIEESLHEGKKKGPSKDKEKKEEEEDIEKITDELEAELSENEIRIVKIIPSNGCTKARIKKELTDEMDDKRIEECLQILIDKDIMSTVKRGRHTIYLIEKESNGGE
ncbi:MAG: hypothetical protein JSV09_08605 [Thermoplasmata archaeon]|nr:MAG: hypothetical protein JSV09_08605 [Thermoplasmata archaeon]